jgi:hypothetical protein
MAQSTVFIPEEIGPRDVEAINPTGAFEDAARSVVTRQND